MKLRIAVDVQHAGKPKPRHNDRGARFQYPDGAHVNETELAREYADACVRRLRREGHMAITNVAPDMLTGWYRTRAQYAAARHCHAYLACHVNAGRGRYALLGHRPQDTLGEMLANMISQDLEQFPELSDARVRKYRLGMRGVSTIRHAAARGMAAVLVEPFFGDNPAHLAAFDPERLGGTLAQSVLDWWNLRLQLHSKPAPVNPAFTHFVPTLSPAVVI